MRVLRRLFSKESKAAERHAEQIEILRKSPLMDMAWYRQTYADIRDRPIDIARHYLEYGAREGRNPHPLFDTNFYLRQNPDVARSGLNPLLHYLLQGAREGRDPHPLFNTKAYLEQNPEVAAQGLNPLIHFDAVRNKNGHAQSYGDGGQLEASDNGPAVNGPANVLDIRPSRAPGGAGNGPAKTLRIAGTKPAATPIRHPAGSPCHALFDVDWYLANNADVKAAGVDPLQHFMQFGWMEMRNPNEMFDTAWYLENNPDVKQAGVNPLEHYAVFGWKEYRDPGPRFSVEFYLQQNQDVLDEGIEPLAHYLRYGKTEGRVARRSTRGNYASYADATRWNLRRERDLLLALAAAQPTLRKISVLMPVYETERTWLVKAIESVRGQLYANFELCISDNASQSPAVREVLDFYSALDPRIRVHYRRDNGHICRNTNDAFRLSSGEFIVLFDSDDELSWDALAEIALAVAHDPQVDFVYTDSDKIGDGGHRYDPHFKPDWSPELLLTYMYAGQCLAVRRQIWESLGGLRVGYEGSQDHDFALRATEIAHKVVHIPRVLYHWRSHSNSTASMSQGGNQKPYSFEAGRRAVQDALERRGVRGIAKRPEFAVNGGNAFFEIEFADSGPKVSIIIPTHDKIALLRKCLESLKATTYGNYEIVIVGNDWIRSRVEPVLNELGHKVLWAPPGPQGGFNFSHKMNWASEQVDGELLVLLNDDTEVRNPAWLSSMVGYSQLPGVGAVGALLRFPDGRVQHAGIICGMQGGRSGHAFRLAQPRDRGYCSLISAARNCSAVTAACLLVSRRLYRDIGGFDAAALGVAYNDPDFCYRVHDAGYRIVYTPTAELTHYEGATRGYGDNPDEEAEYLDRYSERRDPYFNPNFSNSDENFRVKPTNLPIRRSAKAPVAFVSHNMNWEGAPRHLFDVVTMLKRRGFVDPLVLSLAEGPLVEAYEAAGIPVRLLPKTPGWRCQAKHYGDWLRAVQNELTAGRVSAVFANTLECFFAVDAATTLDIPSLWNIHESEGKPYFAAWSDDVRRAALACFRKPYRLIFVSDATAAVYANLDENNISVTIKNGYVPPAGAGWDRTTARRKLGLAAHSLVFLSVGTVCERKSQLDIVAAFSLADIPIADIDKFDLLICSDRPSPYSDKLHQAVRELAEPIRERVRIIPATEDVAVYYAAADAFICSSRMESYPSVIMEAMGAGLSIITTPVFGIAEQVRGNANALLFDPGDCRMLAAHVSRLIKDRKLVAELGRYSRRQLRSLPSARTMINQYEENILQAATASVFRG